jgi:cobalt-zinc-cadmium efflux system membrane fusion protein
MKSIISILAIAILAGCSGKKQAAVTENKQIITENNVTLTDAQMKNAGIQTGKAETKTISSLLKVNGLIDVPPQNLISISFPLGGFLKSTQLLPGMKVRKGEPIAIMEDQSFIQLQQDYLVARTRTEYLQKEFERQQALNSTKASSDKVYEQAKNEYQSQKIQLKALHEKLLLINIDPEKLNENNISRTVNIYSPINGFVSAVNVNIGKYVNPTDILFELMNPDDIHLALTLFEKDVPLVEPGQKVKAWVTNHPEKTYDASVLLVSKKLDMNRSTVIHCHFDKSPHELLPGMFMNANIMVQHNNSLAVPEEAVVRWGDKQFIFVQSGDKTFTMTEVRTGPAENGFILIESDSTNLSNKTIVVKNAYAVLMKMLNKNEE